MTTSTSLLLSFEKLKGQENYSLWKFQLSKFLELDDLWIVTDPAVAENSSLYADDGKKAEQRKALAKISLMVEPACIVHIRNCTTPYDAWKNLKEAFESSGLSRRLRLLRNLFSVRLENHSSIHSYVHESLDLAHQVAAISDPLQDEFMCSLM